MVKGQTIKKKKWYPTKECRYCGKLYGTAHKYSQMCDACKERRFKERFTPKEGVVRSSKSYWKRMMEGIKV